MILRARRSSLARHRLPSRWPGRPVTVAFALVVALPLASIAAQDRRPATTVPTGKDRIVWPDEGPRTWAPRPTSAEISANDLRTRLYGFSDDSMRGRRIGEIGNFKGTDYIAREFKRLGLKPAGDAGTFFQTLPFGPSRFDAAASRLVVAGTALSPQTDWVPVVPSAANGFGGTVNVTDAPVVFGGRWGDSQEFDPALVRGKVVVFLAPPAATGTGGNRGPASFVSCDAVPNRFGADAAIAIEAAARNNPPAGGAGRGGAAARDQRAMRAGAAAVLLVGLDASAASTTGAFAPRMGMQPASNASLLGAATISNEAAAKLFGKPVESLSIGATGSPITATWSYTWQISDAPARNVVAILPGSDPKLASEYVLVSAHNDHVGMNATPVDHDSLRAVNIVTRRQGANDAACIPTADQQRRIDSLLKRARSIRPARLDTVMNGADDDGSGTVVMLEIAEKFAAEKPGRSIIFVSHQGEEAGLLGSRWFTEHPTIPLTAVVAAHNMDMLGKGRAEQVKFGGPNSVQMLGARRLSREFGDVIDSVNANSKEPMAIDKSWDVPANPLNRFCRSDQVSYVLKDIPVTYFSLGYAQDYHQATDEPQYIDYDHAARLGRFIHDVMTAIANKPERLKIAGADPNYPMCR